MKDITIDGEIFFPLHGYEDEYMIAKSGEIYSIRRQRIMNTARKNSYSNIVLCKNGRRSTRTVHRLIMEAFITNSDNLPHINHIDGNKSNNSISNLEWCTISHNQKHAWVSTEKHNKSASDKAMEMNKMTRILSDNDVRSIRDNYIPYKTPAKDIAVKYKVSLSTIRAILEYKIYKEIR